MSFLAWGNFRAFSAKRFVFSANGAISFLAWGNFRAFSAKRFVFSANGTISFLAWGNAPGIRIRSKHQALKARFTSSVISIIIDAMPQSLSKVILHIVFSTKNREPWLEPDVRPRMHSYLATICRDLGADLVRVRSEEHTSELQSLAY